MHGSAKLQFNREDTLSVLRGALLAAGGAIVAYLASDVIPHVDNSTTLGAIIAGTGSTVLNLLRKYLTDSR